MASYIKVLRNKYFTYLVLADTLLDLGKKLSWVTLSWFVYQLTGSTFYTGIIITVTTLAPLLASIFVGPILDRFNRKRIMCNVNLIRGCCILLIPAVLV